MELRGFDSYDVSLGDEMRGERASLGKSLDAAERDMRIKASIISAIEDCNLSGFPNQSVIAGYVRSYARYLGMDADECFQRFCAQSGYRSPSAFRAEGEGDGKTRAADTLALAPGAQLDRSRFAVKPPSVRFLPRISIGAVTSAAALVALICGLSYGGYALLQDIQRVGFAPLPEAPSVVADAPLIDAPSVDTASLPRPNANDYLGGGALASVVAPTELPPLETMRRDGPISAIDPETAGLFARPVEPAPELTIAEALLDAFPPEEYLGIDTSSDGSIAPVAELVERGVAILATKEAWIRVRAGDAVVHEKTLAAGERYALPDRLDEPTLRAGNAGEVFIVVNGVTYGPVGAPGGVVKRVSLTPADVLSSMPETALVPITPDQGTLTEQRAEASVPAE